MKEEDLAAVLCVWKKQASSVPEEHSGGAFNTHHHD